jgi:signal transduction histidine kinase
MDKLAAGAVGEGPPTATSAQTGSRAVAIFDTAGTRLAAAGSPSLMPANPPVAEDSKLVRRTTTVGSEKVGTLFVPFDVQGRRAGTLAVSLPATPAYAAVRGAALRLGALALGTMVGIVAIGALLSRSILRQVKRLVDTNRALGGGDLSARAPVLGHDELGELAAGVNQMAEQLQASYETLESRVVQRTAEVRRLLEERTEFFASISHELRTPLAAILAQADLILDPTYPLERRSRKEIGSSVKISSEQLLSVVNDILEVARAEAGRLDMELRNLKLSDVMKELRHTLEGLAKGAQIRVSVNLPRDLPTVRADGSRVREIILNLVENAVKYTPSGGRVDLTAVERNGCVAVSVADTGVGIPDGAGEQVFEPFYRVPGAKTQGGQPSSGLGLAITKRLVEAHGGAIGFVSRPSEGTTFTFTLPRAKPRISKKVRNGT